MSEPVAWKAPTTLKELKRLLKWGLTWPGAPMRHGEVDWTALPTFGGEEPADTAEIWSWDAENLLVGTCADDLRIVPRQSE